MPQPEVASPGDVPRFTARRVGGGRHWVLRVVGRRLLMAIPLLIFVSGLSFVLVSLTPGDAARQVLGIGASPEEYESLRSALGLDLPVYEQYWNWLQGAVTGDFGSSLYTGESVAHAVDQRLPVTLSLIVGAMLVSSTCGILVGVVSVVRGGSSGRLVDVFALVGFALPSFWVGAQLASIFGVKLGWFPPTGYVNFADSPIDWFRSLVLPVLALSLVSTAVISKQTRTAMLDVLGSEYVRTARANGVSSTSVIWRHALKNAAIPVLTVIGLQAVALLGGSVLIEVVFALPGMGSLVVEAVLAHDLPIVLGVVVYFTVLVVIVNLVIDLAYSALDPRVRAG